MTAPVKIIGAGLVGSEAAWQCARRGVSVQLWEMRPVRSTPAHQTDSFAELVCSNSLKSDTENTAPWLLKEEMRRAGSLLMEIARACAVPAGHALAVDRVTFAAKVTEAISHQPLITIRREEVTRVNQDELTIVATGPLTSDALSREIARRSGSTHLYFYDSISPIVEADSIDMSKVYMAARYDKGTADYINGPALLRETLQMKDHPRIFFAGQICGVEGYVESMATGLMAGVHAAALASELELIAPPRATAFGSLVHYVTQASPKNFQPANVTFDLLPPLESRVRDRQQRHRAQCQKALQEFQDWLARAIPAAALS